MSSPPQPDRPTRVLFDLDFTHQDPLFVDSPGSGAATVQLFTTDDLRDFVLDCELGLHDGAGPDRYGLTFRQSAEERYAACTIDPNGGVALGLIDHGPALVIAEASLDASTGFRRGIGAVNRLSVVACGPAVGCMVNGVAVLGAILDARYASGRAGALLVHTSQTNTARVAVRWAQARAILAETS